jgi:protein SCO1
MTSGVRNTIISCLAIVLAALALTVHFTMREPSLTDAQLRELGVHLLPQPRELPTFELADQHQQPFTNADLDGRRTFMFFGFTHCPDICPVALSELAQVERQLAAADRRALHDRFHGMMVTVDPERDDPETLARYVGAFSPRFTGVHGTRSDLAVFARAVNAAFAAVPHPDPARTDDYVVDHTVNIVLIDPRGRYVGFIAPPFDADAIGRAYASLAQRG